MNEIRTADLEQTHSFWITIWNYFTHFRYVFSADEMQKAITSLNKPHKHYFWKMLDDALWTLVNVPKAKSSFRFKTECNIPAIPTPECLSLMGVNIEPELRKKLAPEQPEIISGTEYVRVLYSAYDFVLLGNISRFFPGRGVYEPFCSTEGNVRADSKIYTLSLIRQLMMGWDVLPGPTSVLCSGDEENIFLVHGRKGPLMVSLRKKLNMWRMREVKAGDNIRGIDTYVFI